MRRRYTILGARIECHRILARAAARDGLAEWVVKHKAAIDRLTLEQCRYAKAAERGRR